MKERLQKILARAGVASRRKAEALIESGAVRVNGKVVDRLGSKADPSVDTITVNRKAVALPAEKVYLVMHKPRGTVCTAHDPGDRRTVFSFLAKMPARVFAVGRLAYEDDGLLLLTSDGEFAEKIARAHLPQTFAVKIKGRLSEGEQDKLQRHGARREPGVFRMLSLRRGSNPWYEFVTSRPQSDWLRTMLFRMGHPVEKMTRTGIGPLRETRLRPGQFRDLARGELDKLRRALSGTRPRRPQAKARRRKIG